MAAAWSRTSGGPSTGGVTAVGRAIGAMTTPRSIRRGIGPGHPTKLAWWGPRPSAQLAPPGGAEPRSGGPTRPASWGPGETRASRARGGEARSPRGQPREGCRMRRSLTQRQRREGRRTLRLRRRRCRRCRRVWTERPAGVIPRRRYAAEVVQLVAILRGQGASWDACAERCVRRGEEPDPRTLRRWRAAGMLARQPPPPSIPGEPLPYLPPCLSTLPGGRRAAPARGP